MITRMRDALARASDISKVFRAFGRDRKGTGAIEFAILAPILIMAYIGAFEVSVGFNVSRKVARASSTVADIVTQQTEVNKEFLDGMKDVAASVMSPFGGTYSLKITGIEVTSVGNGESHLVAGRKGNHALQGWRGRCDPQGTFSSEHLRRAHRNGSPPRVVAVCPRSDLEGTDDQPVENLLLPPAYRRENHLR